MTTLYFENKEHYLTFKKAWAAASQSKSLEASHHILYNILRGLPVERGFTPITNYNKLTNGAYINQGLYSAYSELKWVCSKARKVFHKKYNVGTAEGRKRSYEYDVQYLHRFLDRILDNLPDNFHYEGKKKVDNNFNWFVELLANLDLPKVEAIESNYGKGLKLAQRILEGDMGQLTWTSFGHLCDEFGITMVKEAA